MSKATIVVHLAVDVQDCDNIHEARELLNYMRDKPLTLDGSGYVLDVRILMVGSGVVKNEEVAG